MKIYTESINVIVENFENEQFFINLDDFLGILGIYEYKKFRYLVYAKKPTSRFSININSKKHQIYYLQQFEIIPLDLVSRQQLSLNKYYINQALLKFNLYYCSTYNLTLSFDKQYGGHKYDAENNRFNITNHLAQNLLKHLKLHLKQTVKKLLIFPISGFVSGYLDNDKDYQFILISRRSINGIGKRYHSRGIDVKGDVANFLETEHILIHKKKVHSYVQIRGSTPVKWSQTINLHYTPPANIHVDASFIAFTKHISDLKSHYWSNIVLVDLTNSRGWESRLSKAYQHLTAEFNSKNQNPKTIRYIHYDFHKECSNGNFKKIENLINHINEELSFCIVEFLEDKPKFVTSQISLIRTNCVDCLDRTNVFQAAISLHVINIMKDKFDFPEINMNEFRKIWADNADMISLFYAGTPALKNDYTRTGKRTIKGLLKDFSSSIIRYYLNNFVDGFTQDLYYLAIGLVDENEDKIQDLLNSYHHPYLLLLLILTPLLHVISIVSCFIKPISQSIKYDCLIDFVYFISLLYFIIRNNHLFINIPKLKTQIKS